MTGGTAGEVAARPGGAPDPPARIRRMRWWDITAAVEIEQRAFPDDAWSVETFWAELAERATRRYVVAETGGRLVGYAGIAVVGAEADLQTIAVAAEARGAGLGRRLLAEVTAAAAAEGVRRLLLEVRADNPAAVALYRSAGWDETGRRRGYYRRSDAGSVDALVMTRRLGP
ncbi:MAG: ribosomal protein S18-alanine N-acetyltransferase [Kineosporiaceae bacterium]